MHSTGSCVSRPVFGFNVASKGYHGFTVLGLCYVFDAAAFHDEACGFFINSLSFFFVPPQTEHSIRYFVRGPWPVLDFVITFR